MTDQFAVLDTNMYYRIVTQGQPGCELSQWEIITNKVQGHQLSLLVPEVVLFECEKLFSSLRADFNSRYANTANAIMLSAREAWNEIGDLTAPLDEFLLGWKVEKLSSMEKRAMEIMNYLRSPNAVLIPFTTDTVHSMLRRGLSGKIPKSEKRSESDYFILESLFQYFKDSTNAELLFCTENTKDFGKKVGDQFIFNSKLNHGLPPTQLFTTVSELAEFVGKGMSVENVPEVPPVEQPAHIQEQSRLERIVDNYRNLSKLADVELELERERLHSVRTMLRKNPLVDYVSHRCSIEPEEVIKLIAEAANFDQFVERLPGGSSMRMAVTKSELLEDDYYRIMFQEIGCAWNI